MPNTTIREADWALALDEHLHDIDTLGDYLAGELCHQRDVTDSGVAGLSNALLRGGALQATPPFTVGELLVVLLTATPEVALHARAQLRDRILAAHSEQVARIVWRQQDAEREAATIDFHSEFDAGCEWDGARA